MDRVAVDSSVCARCGLCAELCPNKILRVDREGGVATDPSRIAACFACGHCMAVCPTKAVKVDGLSYSEDFFDLPAGAAGEAGLFALIATRRAIRNFREKAVEKEKLEKIVAAIALAPPTFPPIKYELIVVRNPQTIKAALPLMIELYEFLMGAMKNPISRQFVKREVGARKFATLREHMIPLLEMRLPALKAGTEDTITRGAPAMILFLAEKEGEDASEDIYIAATYCMLYAHSLGLGAAIMDIIPRAVNKKKELRAMFDVPDDREVVASVILGYPKYEFQRGIRRRIKKVTWL